MNREEKRLQLYLSPAHPCSYLPQQTASTLFIDPAARPTPEIYGQLLQQGFRRSGEHVYRPHCEACTACHSARVPVSSFKPKRNQRRIRRLNEQDINLVITPAGFEPEHYALYRRYTAGRHPDGEMSNMDQVQYLGFLTSRWCDTEFLEFRLDGVLVAVAVTDRVPDGLSAVYTFFDPELARRSLGTYAILSQIELARQRGLDWLYLGYWIEQCHKMAYKTDYQPLQLFSDDRWRPYPVDS